MVKLNFVKARDVHPLLFGFRSPHARIQVNENLPHVLVISDLPENVDKMLAAIKEIDVKPSDFLFTVQLILASESEERVGPLLRADPLIQDLRKLLRYQGFLLMDSTVVRATDEEPSSMIIGDAAQFTLDIQGKAVKGQRPELIQIDIRLRQIKEKVDRGAGVIPQIAWIPTNKDLLRSHLNLKSGEGAVVGVSRLDGGEKGLVLVISGKIVE